MSDNHVHLHPEDVLELALEESAGRGLARSTQLRACAACSRALDQSLAELREIRGALGAISIEEQRRSETLVQSVLRGTTRQGSSRRSDWREVRRFFRERWSASPGLRLIAASVALTMIALPVWTITLVLRARHASDVRAKVETPRADAHDRPAAIDVRHDLVADAREASAATISGCAEFPERSERLSKARHDLIETCSPHASGATITGERAAGPCGDVEHLLLARRRRLGQGGLDDTLSEPAANAPLLERALWGELLLDDWALSGRADPRLAVALGRLFDGAKPASAARGAPGHDAEANLALHALERAASYGFELPGFTASADPRPALEPAWFEQLGRACSAIPDTESSGVVAVWLAWGRQHAQ